MSYEINKELVLSTAHIKESTADSLNHTCDAWVDTLSYDNLGEGYRIWTGSEDLAKDTPKELVALLHLARDLDCKWLLLDMDADIHDDLPNWSW